MNIADISELKTYFPYIHDYTIKKYDKYGQEIMKKSNNHSLSFQNDSEQKMQIESILSSYFQKCKELEKTMKSEEEFKDENLDKTIKKIISKK